MSTEYSASSINYRNDEDNRMLAAVAEGKPVCICSARPVLLDEDGNGRHKGSARKSIIGIKEEEPMSSPILFDYWAGRVVGCLWCLEHMLNMLDSWKERQKTSKQIT